MATEVREVGVPPRVAVTLLIALLSGRGIKVTIVKGELTKKGLIQPNKEVE